MEISEYLELSPTGRGVSAETGGREFIEQSHQHVYKIRLDVEIDIERRGETIRRIEGSLLKKVKATFFERCVSRPVYGVAYLEDLLKGVLV
ncbi:MAG TPA: hypothetical protein PLQ35_17275 [bacterium]|nr:hypothetical protein [bacterium]